MSITEDLNKLYRSVDSGTVSNSSLKKLTVDGSSSKLQDAINVLGIFHPADMLTLVEASGHDTALYNGTFNKDVLGVNYSALSSIEGKLDEEKINTLERNVKNVKKTMDTFINDRANSFAQGVENFFRNGKDTYRDTNGHDGDLLKGDVKASELDYDKFHSDKTREAAERNLDILQAQCNYSSLKATVNKLQVYHYWLHQKSAVGKIVFASNAVISKRKKLWSGAAKEFRRHSGLDLSKPMPGEDAEFEKINNDDTLTPSQRRQKKIEMRKKTAKKFFELSIRSHAKTQFMDEGFENYDYIMNHIYRPAMNHRKTIYTILNKEQTEKLSEELKEELKLAKEANAIDSEKKGQFSKFSEYEEKYNWFADRIKDHPELMQSSVYKRLLQIYGKIAIVNARGDASLLEYRIQRELEAPMMRLIKVCKEYQDENRRKEQLAKVSASISGRIIGLFRDAQTRVNESYNKSVERGDKSKRTDQLDSTDAMARNYLPPDAYEFLQAVQDKDKGGEEGNLRQVVKYASKVKRKIETTTPMPLQVYNKQLEELNQNSFLYAGKYIGAYTGEVFKKLLTAIAAVGAAPYKLVQYLTGEVPSKLNMLLNAVLSDTHIPSSPYEADPHEYQKYLKEYTQYVSTAHAIVRDIQGIFYALEYVNKLLANYTKFKTRNIADKDAKKAAQWPETTYSLLITPIHNVGVLLMQSHARKSYEDRALELFFNLFRDDKHGLLTGEKKKECFRTYKALTVLEVAYAVNKNEKKLFGISGSEMELTQNLLGSMLESTLELPLEAGKPKTDESGQPLLDDKGQQKLVTDEEAYESCEKYLKKKEALRLALDNCELSQDEIRSLCKQLGEIDNLTADKLGIMLNNEEEEKIKASDKGVHERIRQNLIREKVEKAKTELVEGVIANCLLKQPSIKELIEKEKEEAQQKQQKQQTQQAQQTEKPKSALEEELKKRITTASEGQKKYKVHVFSSLETDMTVANKEDKTDKTNKEDKTNKIISFEERCAQTLSKLEQNLKGIKDPKERLLWKLRRISIQKNLLMHKLLKAKQATENGDFSRRDDVLKYTHEINELDANRQILEKIGEMGGLVEMKKDSGMEKEIANLKNENKKQSEQIAHLERQGEHRERQGTRDKTSLMVNMTQRLGDINKTQAAVFNQYLKADEEDSKKGDCFSVNAYHDIMKKDLETLDKVVAKNVADKKVADKKVAGNQSIPANVIEEALRNTRQNAKNPIPIQGKSPTDQGELTPVLQKK